MPAPRADDVPPRTVAVFTGSRSEYGLLVPVLRALAGDPRLEPIVLAGGSHLDEDFGATLGEIEGDGFRVRARVDTTTPRDTLSATAQAIGMGVLRLARVLEEQPPDLLVVYGDRFETFAAAIAGTQLRIPTAHIEGGDYTEGGALDDSVRHAITKLCHLHFATNPDAAERIRRLGEEAWRVHLVGLPALDLIARGAYASPDEICRDLGIDLSRPVVLFCQHAVATEFEKAGEQVRPSLEALERLAGRGYQVVITYPNNDAGGRRIVEELKSLETTPGIRLVKSLGRHRFHGLLCVLGRVGRGVVVGNSSAGLKEAPAFGCPAVNIGSRQDGRLRAGNVLDVVYDADAIEAAIRRGVEDGDFRARCATCGSPYGVGEAGARIAEVLATVSLDEHLLRKRMTF